MLLPRSSSKGRRGRQRHGRGRFHLNFRLRGASEDKVAYSISKGTDEEYTWR